MKATAIFLPALLLMFWTLTVLLLVPIRRVRAVMHKRLTPKDFSHGESPRVNHLTVVQHQHIDTVAIDLARSSGRTRDEALTCMVSPTLCPPAFASH